MTKTIFVISFMAAICFTLITAEEKRVGGDVLNSTISGVDAKNGKTAAVIHGAANSIPAGKQVNGTGGRDKNESKEFGSQVNGGSSGHNQSGHVGEHKQVKDAEQVHMKEGGQGHAPGTEHDHRHVKTHGDIHTGHHANEQGARQGSEQGHVQTAGQKHAAGGIGRSQTNAKAVAQATGQSHGHGQNPSQVQGSSQGLSQTYLQDTKQVGVQHDQGAGIGKVHNEVNNQRFGQLAGQKVQGGAQGQHQGVVQESQKEIGQTYSQANGKEYTHVNGQGGGKEERTRESGQSHVNGVKPGHVQNGGNGEFNSQGGWPGGFAFVNSASPGFRSQAGGLAGFSAQRTGSTLLGQHFNGNGNGLGGYSGAQGFGVQGGRFSGFGGQRETFGRFGPQGGSTSDIAMAQQGHGTLRGLGQTGSGRQQNFGSQGVALGGSGGQQGFGGKQGLGGQQGAVPGQF